MIRRSKFWTRGAGALLTVLCALASAQSRPAALQLDPAKTQVTFTLEAVLHSVHGTFRARPCVLTLDFSTGSLTGEIVVDAKSGDSGNGMRDRKMHKDVLESDSYPEISFRPDRVEGVVAGTGKSSVKVHGMFRIHGVDREISVPADVDMSPDSWTANVHFTIPYAKWGMNNPSNLFLHVSDSVVIDLVAAGTVVQHSATIRNAAQ
jgi:polyisoprenoid-binding protein YceI